MAVTSGCLTPLGFEPKGLKQTRMRRADALAGTVSADEVLISRSNTEELVGRAALYEGDPPNVVATDLIFRVAPEVSRIDPRFLTGFLAALQITGYWRDRSSGASSTMKKITRALVASVEVPLPPLDTQRRIAVELREQLARIDSMTRGIEAQLKAIEALPAALLRQAFDGLEAA